MSLPRSGKKKTKLLINQENPSPTYQDFFLNFARGSETSVSGATRHRFIRCRFAEGSSLFTFLFRKVKAGMTVEAAVVLPIFLLFMLNMGSALEMIRLHGNVQLGLWDVGRKLALYGYAVDAGGLWEDARDDAQYGTDGSGDEGDLHGEKRENEEEEGFLQRLGELVFVSTYVKEELLEKVGVKYLDESPVIGGSQGLLLLESDVLSGRDELEITVTYGVRPFLNLGKRFGFGMVNRYYTHLWNGYEIPDVEEAEDVQVAYLAEHAQVYHLDRRCSHLNLAVRQIPMHMLGVVRNSYGERYDECKKCGTSEVLDGEMLSDNGDGVAGMDGFMWTTMCYIAEDGDCYHWNPECAGLKRTVRCVLLEEAERYRPCSRCAK